MAPDADPIEFLETAVATPSNDDPAAMRELLVETLAAADADPRVDDAGTVLASRGTGAPHVVLNTHLDTVSPHVPVERTAEVPGPAGDDATGPTDADGEVLRGRGACDAKGPLAATLAAFLDADPPGRLTLAVTPDEETLSTGAHALVARDDSPLAGADGVVVGEPTGLDVCTAARGRYEATVTLRGAAAHAASDAGANAVSAAAAAIRAIEGYDEAAGTVAHEQLGAPSLTVTGVEGGEATNRTPATCRLTVDRRPVPPETAAAFRDGLAAHLRAAVGDRFGVDVSLTVRPTPFLSAFATDPDEPLVGRLADAAREAAAESDGASGAAGDGAPTDDGTAGEVRPFGAATEAAYFADLAPTVVFGPGELADDVGPIAHAEREYVRVAAVRAAARALTRALSASA
jgi:acetylornithine deacetylase